MRSICDALCDACECVHAQIDTINISGYFLVVIKWLNEYEYVRRWLYTG